jgi:hypothetical protein
MDRERLAMERMHALRVEGHERELIQRRKAMHTDVNVPPFNSFDARRGVGGDEQNVVRMEPYIALADRPAIEGADIAPRHASCDREIADESLGAGERRPPTISDDTRTTHGVDATELPLPNPGDDEPRDVVTVRESPCLLRPHEMERGPIARMLEAFRVSHVPLRAPQGFGLAWRVRVVQPM